jgi:hypothetical protein
MSPWLVSKRRVDPLPAPVVSVPTMLAATKRSVAFLVITVPLLLEVLLPVAVALTSSALSGSTPLYSRIRMSTEIAAALNFTVTVFVPAAAAAMFLA